MAKDSVERRLAAVLAADVVGYSRLMGADEEGTLAQLKATRKNLVDPTIAVHRGRIVKTTGDGILAEFASVVDAARCAMEVQREMIKQNADSRDGLKIVFRIGLHVGDIIFDDNDIFGDGVNVSARLEGIAPPGGVCISDDVYRQIRGKIDAAFDDLGPQALKNIVEPMRAWNLRVDDASSPTPVSTYPVGVTRPLALPDKPSIAVLPFQNMSGDPEQEYFADGIVDDIITALSRFKSLFVIARNSSFTYKGKTVDVKQVGRELGVRYVLEGSVRRAGGRLRLTGQLIEASTGGHVWADSFDGSLEDIFDLQDSMTKSVIIAIAPALERTEMAISLRKHSNNLGAVDCYYRSVAAFREGGTAAIERMLEFARRATIIDPTYAVAYGQIASGYVAMTAIGIPLSETQLEEGRLSANQAIVLGGDDAVALAHASTFIGLVLKEAATAEPIIEKAIAINPNLSLACMAQGFIFLWLGKHNEAIGKFERALRLSPIDHRVAIARIGIGQCHFYERRFDNALDLYRSAMAQAPNDPSPYSQAARALAMLGKLAEADAALKRSEALGGDKATIEERERLSPFTQDDTALYLEAYRRIEDYRRSKTK